MTKIYAIHGYRCVTLAIPTGSGAAAISVEFTKGSPEGNSYRPATFLTTSPIVQAIIERSHYFGSMIVLHRQYGSDENTIPAPVKNQDPVEAPVEAAPKKTTKKAATAAPAQKEFPEVTTHEELLLTLKKCGAKATTLVDDEAIKVFVQQNGLSFPNYVID